MGRGNKEMLDEILFFCGRADYSLSSAALRAVETSGIPFDVSFVGDSDDHVLFGDEVFDGEIGGLGDDLRTPFVGESFTEIDEFFFDDCVDLLWASENGLKMLNQDYGLSVLGQDFPLF